MGVACALTLTLVPVSQADESLGRQGVTPRSIKVGVHAPYTGAVPIPQESVEEGARVFWRWRRRTQRPINGRHVEVVFRNDNTNPTAAQTVCREMIEQERVAMIFGFFSGPNEILTCAQVAARHRVPYLSMGTTKTGVRRLRHYFAVSAPWRRQSRLLAAHLVSDLGVTDAENGAVYYNNPAYRPVGRAFAARMGELGATVGYQKEISKGATSSEAQLIVQEMKLRGVENVFVHTSPTFFLQLLQQARSQDYSPRWAGIAAGIAGSQSVVNVGCRNGTFERNRFVSPLPAFSDRDRFDQSYGRAMQRIYGDEGDDITWRGWAASKAAARLLQRAGRKLTSRRFVRSTERARGVETGILPAMSFRRNDHFGGRGVHVLHADCRARTWRTIKRFVTEF